MIVIFVEGQRLDIPISQISAIEWDDHQPKLFLNNGDSFQISHKDLDQIQRKSATTSVLAAADTYYLSYFNDHEGEEITRVPVLGWKVDGAGRTRPLILKFDDADADDYAIRYPDRTVEDIDGARWDTEQEWIDSQRS